MTMPNALAKNPSPDAPAACPPRPTLAAEVAPKLLAQCGAFGVGENFDSPELGSRHSPCLLYTGKLNPDGYWQIGDGRYAHRVICEAHHGPIPEGHEVDHICGNRECQNPEHLRAVAKRVNLRRRKAPNSGMRKPKQRHSFGLREGDGRVNRALKLRDAWVWVAQQEAFVNAQNPAEVLKANAINDTYRDVVLPGIWLGNPAEWLREANRGTNNATLMDFAPGEPRLFRRERDDARVMNLWSAPEVTPWPEPVEVDDVLPALHLISFLCGMGPDFKKPKPDGWCDWHALKMEYLLWWIAHTVRHPAQRINSYVLITGAQGTGKSTLAEKLIAPLVGGAQGHVTTKDIKRDFQDWALNRKLVIVEEAKERGNYEFANTLKPYITGSTVPINPKGRPRFDITNALQFVVLSNFSDALVLEEGDRRCFHLRCPDGKLPPSFWQQFYTWYENGGREKWFRYLLDATPHGFSITDEPPRTPEKLTLIADSAHPVRTAVTEGKDSEHPMFADGVLFRWDDLHNYLESTEAKGTLRDPKTVKAEAETAGVRAVFRQRVNGQRPMLYTAGSVDTAKARWDELGQKALYNNREF